MSDDLISRQAAIDTVTITPQKWDGMYIQDLNCRLRDTLNALPSAQPEIEPIDYTDKGKYLRACGFAISQMIERGSSAVVFSIHSDHPVQVRYEDVLEWIDKQLDVIGYSKDGNVSGVEEAEKGR